MNSLVGLSKNIVGIVIDGIDAPVGSVEIILMESRPKYRFLNDDKVGKGREIHEHRFHADPEMLRTIAAYFIQFACECEARFQTPNLDAVDHQVGNHPVTFVHDASDTPH